MVVFHIFLYYVVQSLINHLSATVVFTCCAVALTLYWSCIRFFIFSSVSSITSFQPSTRSRYCSSDWLRSLIDMRWFCISCVSRLLVAFRVVWVWETWSRTWRVKSWGSETKSQAPPSFFVCFSVIGCLKVRIGFWTVIWTMDLLLSEYHSLDVFKLLLQPADLLAVQRHIQTAWAVRRGAQVCETKEKENEKRKSEARWKFMMSVNDISKPLVTTCVFYYAGIWPLFAPHSIISHFIKALKHII